MKAQMDNQDGVQNILDKFMELPQEDRDWIIVHLFFHNAVLNKRIVGEEVLCLLAGVAGYMNWQLEKNGFNKIERDKRINVVKGLYAAVVKHMESHATDDKE